MVVARHGVAGDGHQLGPAPRLAYRLLRPAQAGVGESQGAVDGGLTRLVRRPLLQDGDRRIEIGAGTAGLAQPPADPGVGQVVVGAIDAGVARAQGVQGAGQLGPEHVNDHPRRLAAHQQLAGWQAA